MPNTTVEVTPEMLARTILGGQAVGPVRLDVPADQLPCTIEHERWYPTSEYTGLTKIDTARKLCKGCPMVLGCLTGALESASDFGIRGATTGAERAALLRGFMGVAAGLPKVDEFFEAA
jgi:hypothetical protein